MPVTRSDWPLAVVKTITGLPPEISTVMIVSSVPVVPAPPVVAYCAPEPWMVKLAVPAGIVNAIADVQVHVPAGMFTVADDCVTELRAVWTSLVLHEAALIVCAPRGIPEKTQRKIAKVSDFTNLFMKLPLCVSVINIFISYGCSENSMLPTLSGL